MRKTKRTVTVPKVRLSSFEVESPPEVIHVEVETIEIPLRVIEAEVETIEIPLRVMHRKAESNS